MTKEKELDFDARRTMFEEELIKTQEKHNVSLYAANIVLPNQEVAPVIKMLDNLEAPPVTSEK